MDPTRPILTFYACLLTLSLGLPSGYSVAATDQQATGIARGKQIAFEPKKGNCLACHDIVGGDSPGTIGPALVSMKARFPDRHKLRQQIWDSRENNPHTIMPPFGKYRILTEKEIEQLIDFLYTL